MVLNYKSPAVARAAARGGIILAGPDHWRIGAWSDSGAVWIDTDIPAGATGQEIAERLPAALDRAGCRGKPIVLGLPSDACLAASIATTGLPRKDRRRAMGYRLEEKLPLAIEELSADFLVHNGQALGVGIRADVLDAMVRAIAKSGARVAGACPAALLALQACAGGDGEKTRGHCDAMVLQWGDEIDLFVLDDGEPVGWYSAPAQALDLAVALAPLIVARGRRIRLATCGVSAELLGAMRQLPDVDVEDVLDQSAADAALAGAKRVQAGDRPWLDLRRDGGGETYRAVRQPLAAAALGCVLLFACISIGLLWRGARYADVAGVYDTQKRQAFHRAFPGEPIPAGVESRLRSVASHLNGPSVVSTAGPSALALLYNVLKNLPAGVRFQIEEMEFNPTLVTLRGKVPSHATVDAIRAALRQIDGLAVDEPQTRELNGGEIEFTLTAKVLGGAGKALP